MFLLSVLLIVPFSLFMFILWPTRRSFPLVLSACVVIWIAHFYVNGAVIKKDRIFPSEMTKLPWIQPFVCGFALFSQMFCNPLKVALHHVLTKLNLTTVSFIWSQCLFQKLETTAFCILASAVKTVNACKKWSAASPRGSSCSLFLSLFLMYTTDNTIHKERFLSYLSSCFRYFCKLQGARIINHCETRWQSASIVAKKTNETTHPGKWPADLVWYWLPTLTEMWYTGSLSRSLPWFALSQPRPDKATKANQWGSLSVCSITGMQTYFRSGCLTATERERAVCWCELEFPLVIHI